MPFANYQNFADCMQKNKNKKNPSAYCASVMRSAEPKHSNKAIKMARGMLKNG